MAIAQASGLERQEARVLNSLAIVEQYRHGVAAAEPLYLQAREIAESIGDRQLAAMIDQNVGSLANIQGHAADALVAYESALSRLVALGDEATSARVLHNMGMAHVDLEQWQPAEDCYGRAAAIAEQLGDHTMLGMVELNRAELHLRRQHYEDARDSCERALEIFNRSKAKARIAEAYKFYGILYRETAKLSLAHTHFAMALGLAEVTQDRLLQAEAQSEWAMAHVDGGRYREAVMCLNRAHLVFSDLRARREVLDIERRLEELRRRYLPAVQAWGAQAVEARTRYLAGHNRRVAAYGTALARQVGYDDGWDLALFQVGAFVHDIGKSAVPAVVLNKPGALSADERELVQSHPIVGEGIITELEFPREIAPLVRSQHEHWDGSGYPDRIGEEEIPLGARILCVADIYDALTSARSYRPAYAPADALGVMEQESGRTFDPELFGVFRDLVEQGDPGQEIAGPAA